VEERTIKSASGTILAYLAETQQLNNDRIRNNQHTNIFICIISQVSFFSKPLLYLKEISYPAPENSMGQRLRRKSQEKRQNMIFTGYFKVVHPVGGGTR